MAENTARKITHKTDAVMKLLTGGNLAVNPMLDNEFKQSVIEMRSAEDIKREEIKKETVKAAEVSNTEKSFDSTEVCISSELITEILPQALRRFNCCMCPKCFAEAMTEALDAVPSISIKIHNDDDVKKMDGIKKQNRLDVMRAIIKLAITRRNLPLHKQ